MQELVEPVDEVEVAEVVDRHPPGLGRVVARDEGRPGIERRDREVEDHEVRTRRRRRVGTVAEALGPAEEAVDHDLEPGLLVGLAHDGLVQRLAQLDPPAGHRPLPCAGPLPRRTRRSASSTIATAPTATTGCPEVDPPATAAVTAAGRGAW